MKIINQLENTVIVELSKRESSFCGAALREMFEELRADDEVKRRIGIFRKTLQDFAYSFIREIRSFREQKGGNKNPTFFRNDLMNNADVA